MQRSSLRIELRLDDSLKARYEGPLCRGVSECGEKVPATRAAAPPKPVPKDHNAGGKSCWMQGFFDRPSPALWQAVRESNVRG